jgi:chitin disaccharide deacetylase
LSRQETDVKPIAVCVDDYGLHAGVNEAAIALARAGRISAIGVMVGASAWPQGIAALRALPAEDVDVGLHLDLTEHPLPGFAHRPLWHWLAGAALRPRVRADVRREIAAQLDAFEAAMGRPPAFVDGHRHVHQLPGVRAELLAVLAVRGDEPQPWLRDARPPRSAPWCGGKPWLLAVVGSAGLRRAARTGGWRQNRRLLGVYDFQPDARRYLALADRWLQAARPCDLWMCHPAATAPAGDPIAGARLAEYQVLASPEFGALLQAARVRVLPLSRTMLR